ncbi:MAG: acetylglutamate kinase [Planctomycetota bacterium]
MKLLVKVGGASIETLPGRTALAESVVKARAAGHTVVLVHGGGNQIRSLGKRLGLVDRYVDGLRVTDAETADVVLMTLGGQVNREVTAALQAAGVPAVGLSGADGHTFTARRYQRGGVDLGYVGEVARVEPHLVATLVGAGYTPVLATVAPLAPGEDAPSDHFYNVNADQAAGPLAAAFAVDALLFLSDVPGVRDGHGHTLPCLTPAQCADLRRTGVVSGGMIPKVEAALHARTACPPHTTVKIAVAHGDDAILRALEPERGTTFLHD